jgi:hypothetical protein
MRISGPPSDTVLIYEAASGILRTWPRDLRKDSPGERG